jgi:hypothetical protein
MHLTAAVDWNSKQGNIPRKWGIEYRDVLGSVKISGKKKERKEIDVYAVDEVYRILMLLKMIPILGLRASTVNITSTFTFFG